MNSKLFRCVQIALAVVLLVSPGWSESLEIPEELSVSHDGSTFRGRWQAVKGASHYEVWTKLYGNWRFDSKEPEMSPFTSSFEVRGSDDRMWFKVRAISGSGKVGPFSDEVQAIPTVVGASPQRPVLTDPSDKRDDFDPETPAPEPPSSLFTVWTDPREIRLVWQASPKAIRYTVEELKDGKWVSLPKVDYPKPTTAVIKDKPQPGPYQFRVRAVGRNGRTSEPSRPTTARIGR